MEPIVNRLEEKYNGKVSVKRVDANSELKLAEEFEIQYVPTYIFLNSNGDVVQEVVGGNVEALESAFERLAGSR